MSHNQQVKSLKFAINQLGINNLDSIITLASQLHQVAEKLGDINHQAFAAKEMAWAYKQQQHLAVSIGFYFKASRLYQQLSDSASLGTAYYNIALIFAMAQEQNKSLYYLEQAVSCYQAAEQQYKMSQALYDLAKRHIEKKDLNTADSLLFEALILCSNSEDKHRSLQSMIYNRLGWTAKDREDHACARSYYRKSLSMLDQSPQWDKKRAIFDNNMAESFFLERQFDSAKVYIKKALTRKESLKNADFTLSTYVLLAKLQFEMGNPNKALSTLDHGVAKVKVTNKLSKNINEAMAVVTSIMNTSTVGDSLPITSYFRFLEIQQQQFMALQDLKYHLEKYSVQAEENLHAQEKNNEFLQASLTNQESMLTTLQITIGIISVFLALALMVGFPLIKRLKERNRKTLEDKEAFVRDLISEYDHKIIQLMIIKAEYEEILSQKD